MLNIKRHCTFCHTAYLRVSLNTYREYRSFP